MRSFLTLTAAALLLLLPSLSAQQPPPDRPRGQMPALGRPTQSDDPVPLFDFDSYFIGTWSFEWIVPESPLGPATELTGTTTYKAIDGRFYEADTQAKGQSGKITIRERIAYHKENKTLSRHLVDSRGFSYLQIGPVGGDLGGFYNVNYESEPFTFKGRSIRIRDSMRMVSPVNYRVSTTISVDRGPFTNYGNPWFQKQVSAVTK
jgi:hypothetical protein